MAELNQRNSPSPNASGVLLLGSIRLPDEQDDDPPSPSLVFQTISHALPSLLARMPDGETGMRRNFVRWQDRAFLPSPWIFNAGELTARAVTAPENATSLEITLGSAGYDEQAISSYGVFAELQQKGLVHPKTRFQVCIATPINVLIRYVS